MAIAKRVVAPIAQKVRLAVSRGVVELVNDSLKCQSLQVSLLADEVQDEVEHFQEYGFTSVASQGAEALFLSVGGSRSHGIVACVTDRRIRPLDLLEGDVCLFTADGERVYIEKAADIVHLGAKVADDFLAKQTETEANDQDIVDAYTPHVHPTGTGPSGTTTSLPTTPVGSVGTTKVKAT